MPVIFRTIKLTKPKIKNIRKDAYLNGRKLWVQPKSTTTISSDKIEIVSLFNPSLTVTASSNESGRGNPQNILDENTNTLWQSQGAAPQWIYITLTKPAVATSYTLTCNGNEPVNLPTAWQIRGSNDAVLWDILHHVSGWDPLDKWSQTWEIPKESQKEYLYYQFYCTSVRTSNYWVYLTEWQLYGY
jgi:hypothetical protein